MYTVTLLRPMKVWWLRRKCCLYMKEVYIISGTKSNFNRCNNNIKIYIFFVLTFIQLSYSRGFSSLDKYPWYIPPFSEISSPSAAGWSLIRCRLWGNVWTGNLWRLEGLSSPGLGFVSWAGLGWAVWLWRWWVLPLTGFDCWVAPGGLLPLPHSLAPPRLAATSGPKRLARGHWHLPPSTMATHRVKRKREWACVCMCA